MPYLEFLAGVGATDLAVKEINSRWTFVLEGGAGLAYMVTDRLAVSAGARLYHVSNAETKQPNLGVNALEGVAGISWFFH